MCLAGQSHLDDFFRFSFGALPAEGFEEDARILTAVMQELRQE